MNDDDLTTDLGRELRGRSDQMHGSWLALADVQRKARSIRRRRTATAVGGAVAAIALIVPTAALANHYNGHSTEPLPPATQSVDPTPSPSPGETDGRQPPVGVLDVSDLPTGDAPRMDYVQDGTFHTTDGDAFDVGTRHRPDQFVELADGSVVWQTSDRNGSSFVELRDPDGIYHDPVPTTSGLSVNAAHSIVAWLDPSGQVTIFEGWASQPRPLGDPVPGTDLRIGPVTGTGEAAPGKTGPDCRQSGCTVIVNVRGGQGQPWEVGESGSQELRDGGYLSVSDISRGGLTVGLTRITDFGSCSKLLGGGEFQGFETCQHTLVSFSPDEQVLLADPAYHDGIGNGVIAMYDVATGDPLFERHSTVKAQSFYLAATWEDDTHVLAPVFQNGAWALVRIATDGSMEYAVPPVAGEDVADPFVLPTGGGLPS